MEEYEALVRDQLNALGYNSEAIPDEVRQLSVLRRAARKSPHYSTTREQVLREFLREFEGKAIISDDASLDAESLERNRSTSEAPGGDSAASHQQRMAQLSGLPAAPKRYSGKGNFLSEEESEPVSIASSSRKKSSPHEERQIESTMENSGSSKNPISSARPSSASYRAPARAPLSVLSTPRRGSSSVIRSGSCSAISGCAWYKSDPVAMHARREQQWKSDSFLSATPRRNVTMSSPAPARTITSSNRVRARTPKANAYVVPSTKRRDALVWETRLRMRQARQAGSTPKPQKTMVPNSFVPPTDKPRRDLRWQVNELDHF